MDQASQVVHKDTTSPLIRAVLAGRGDEVQTLLRLEGSAAVDVNAVDDQGCTALIVAAAHGEASLVEMLLDADAQVQRASIDGETALHAAARHGSAPIAQRLIRAGADVNAMDADGSTPLHIAAWNAQASVIEVLLTHGADAMLRDVDGDVAFQVGAMRDVAIAGSDRPRSLSLIEQAMPVEARATVRAEMERQVLNGTAHDAFEGASIAQPSTRPRF